jgi:hypothetical protein
MESARQNTGPPVERPRLALPSFGDSFSFNDRKGYVAYSSSHNTTVR